MLQEITQYGIAIIIAVLVIRELFSLTRFIIEKLGKKQSVNGGERAVLDGILTQMKTQNENHLHAIGEQMGGIRDDITAGNGQVVEAIKAMHIDIVGRLGEIKGLLNK